MARPTDYSLETAEYICSEIAIGRSLRSISRDDNCPAEGTIYRWLLTHKEFQENYMRAREAQADVYAEEIIQIADDGTNDTQIDDDGIVTINHDVIARSRLRVEARKWVAAKLKPKKYGDRVTQEHVGDKENPIIHEVRRTIIDKSSNDTSIT